MRSIQVFLTSLVLGAALTACGGGDEPAAVCTSVSDLSDSVSALHKADLMSSGGFADLKDALAAVRTDLGQVRSDPRTVLRRVQGGRHLLRRPPCRHRGGGQHAVAGRPSAVRTALSGFGTEFKGFVADVRATC